MTRQIYGRASRLIPTPEQVNKLIQDLKSPHREIRASTVLALGKMRFPPASALPTLIEALKDKETFVRFNAAFALGQMRFESLFDEPALLEFCKDALPALTEALKDKDSGVRACAASALGKRAFYTASIVPRLLELLEEQDTEVRGWAAYTLGEIASGMEKRLGDMDDLVLTQRLTLWQSVPTSLDERVRTETLYPRTFARAAVAVRRLVEALQREQQTRSHETPPQPNGNRLP